MERLSGFGELATASAIGSACGACWFGFWMSIAAAISTGRITDAGWMIVIVPLALLVAVFTAWPAGLVIGAVVVRIVGGNVAAALVTGYLTASAFLWMLSDFAWPDFDAGTLAVTIAMLSAGLVGGFAGYRFVSRPSGFNTERYP